MQETLTYITLALALGFLIKKYFLKSRKKDSCGSDGCGC